MRPLDPDTPRGRQAEAELNAVLASVARRRERERRQAELSASSPASAATSPVARPA